MSEQNFHAAGSAGDTAAPSRLAAGAMLHQAREAAGLTIDAAAHQLKLAPRQVRALEDGDFASLPGRTFVRGFVRNYARLLHLDPDAVLDALPGASAGPALDAPTLHPTAPSIGELPTTETHRPGWTRWAIPLTLAAIVAAAAVYEFLRPGAEPHRGTAQETVSTLPPGTSGTEPVPAPEAPASTSLPNPIASAPPSPPTGGSEATPGTRANPAAAPSASPNATAVPAAPSSVSVAATPPLPTAAKAPAPASAKAGAPTAPHAASPSPEPTAVAEATLALTFRDYSWVEVKDRNGRVLLSRMNAGGTSETVSGPPPLDVVIGNASDVKVTFRGKPVDLAPYTRQNVAKVVLP